MYRKIKPHKIPEADLRRIWQEEYCDPLKPIHTFDGILVKFYEDMFDHVFYESANNRARDKSILSLNRLEKIYWIKDTLQDETALLKKGWDRDKKQYVDDRRLAFVKGNYLVIISVNKQRTAARFITAYEMQPEENIEKVRNSPDWT